VKSAKHSSNFTLGLNLTNQRLVTVLSVSSKGLLLVGQQWDERQLHVYSADCSYVTSIELPTNIYVRDAVWTLRGNIIYNEVTSGNVVTMTRSGDVIRLTAGFVFSGLSVSTDGVIYAIHKQKDVYQSADEGLTWRRMFIVSESGTCDQVIKVSADSNTDVLWASIRSGTRRLLVYTVDNRRADGDRVISQRDVALPTHVSMDASSKLVYDGHTSIFATDNLNLAVHVWSVSGQYDRQLLSSEQLISHRTSRITSHITTHHIDCIAVDVQRHLMYVGHEQGRVDVFELTYEPL
jgi:phosphoribosyl-AMP cyclohydrolase